MNPAGAKRSTVRDLLTVMSGTAGAQALGLLVLPVLARAFAPEAFGVFQLYLSLLIFCTVGIALRIELTLLSKPEPSAQHALDSLFLLVLATSVLLTAALSVYGIIGSGLGFPAIFFGLGLVGNGFVQVSSYKLIRDQNFSRIAAVKVLQVVIYAGVAVTIAVINPTVWGIIVADVAGRLASGVFGFYLVRNRIATGKLHHRLLRLPQFVRDHREMVVISLPGALANSAGAMLTPFMIFHMFGALLAGQYSLVDRSIGVPVAMVVNAGSQVFIGRITSLLLDGRRKEATRIFVQIVSAGAAICGIGAAVAYSMLPWAFELVFGSGWDVAAQIGRIMIFAYAIMLVTGVVNQTLIALSAFRLQSMWDLSWPLVIGMSWIAVASFDLDLLTAIRLYALAVGALGIVFIALCLIRLRSGDPSAHPRKV